MLQGRAIQLDSLCLQGGHGLAHVAAGIDALPGCQIHVPVDGQPVVGRATADAQPQGRDLGPVHVDPGGVIPVHGLNAQAGKEIDNAFLNGGYQAAAAQAQAFDIQHQVNHCLAGAVVGDLPATVTVYHRNVPRIEHMLRLACLPQGKDRRVFQHP